MNGQSVKKELLRTGMGFFVFASGVVLLNGLLLPFARAYYGYPWALTWVFFVIFALAFVILSKRLAAVDGERLAYIAKCVVPTYLVLLFAVQVILGYWLEYTPLGDNLMLFYGPQMLALEGSFANKPDFGLYLARYSNQWGFFLMMTGMFKLLYAAGVTRFFLAFVIILALLHTAGFASLLRIAKRIRGARGQLVMVALLSFCLPMWLAASVLYTDTFSMPFVILALEAALRAAGEKDAKRQIGSALLCALFALIGGQIKMTAAIVLIAAVIVWLMEMRLLRAVICTMLCSAVFLGGSAMVKQIMLEHVVDPAVHAQQHTPAIHWIMMSIPTGDNPYGGYTGDYGITWGMMDAGAPREEIMDSIYTRMKDRIYTLRYPNRLITAALRKNAAAMCDGTFGMTEMLDDVPVRENMVSSFVLSGRPYYAAYGALCTGMHMACVLLAVVGCVRDIRKRDVRLALVYIAMFGMMLFLMIWEARSRYLLSFVPMLLLLACALLSRLPGRKYDEE